MPYDCIKDTSKVTHRFLSQVRLLQIFVAINISIFVIVIIIITICVSCFGPTFVLLELSLVPVVFVMLVFVLLAIIMCSVFLSCFRSSCYNYVLSVFVLFSCFLL